MDLEIKFIIMDLPEHQDLFRFSWIIEDSF